MVAFVLPFKSRSKALTSGTPCTAEEALIAGIIAGDKKAIDQLYKMYASSLFGIITRIVKFDEIAEDVLQDTFVKIWKSIGQYNSSKGRLFTWMANLAKNTAIDQIRSKHYVNAIKTDDLEEMPVDILDRKNHVVINSDVIGLKQLMENLKTDQKRIIDLFYFEGYTHVEVADLLNIPLGTVKTKIRHAVISLRQYFNETNPYLNAKRA
jgi:RNA polymerase sigma factor (sigma-70 family)